MLDHLQTKVVVMASHHRADLRLRKCGQTRPRRRLRPDFGMELGRVPWRSHRSRLKWIRAAGSLDAVC